MYKHQLFVCCFIHTTTIFDNFSILGDYLIPFNLDLTK